MEKVLKRTIIISLIALLLVSIYCCQSIDLTRASNLHIEGKLQIAGSFSVPGMFCEEIKGMASDAEIIETDDYGRILYSYTTYNAILNVENCTATVICQKIDDDYIYFYEDVCYIVSGISEQTVDDLKEENDWNKELDKSKLSQRLYRVSLDLFIVDDLDYDDLDVAWSDFENETKTSDLKQISNAFLGQPYPTNETSMWWRSVEKDSEIVNYVIIFKEDKVLDYIVIEDVSKLPETLHSFKQKNGWFPDY